MQKKYTIRDRWGRKVGTATEVPSSSLGTVGCILLVVVFTVGLIFLPFALGLYLLLRGWRRQPGWLKWVWVASCFIYAIYYIWEGAPGSLVVSALSAVLGIAGTIIRLKESGAIDI